MPGDPSPIDLPADIQQLIVGALHDTYLHVPHPDVKGTLPFLGNGEINRAYQMLYTAFEFISGKEALKPVRCHRRIVSG